MGSLSAGAHLVPFERVLALELENVAGLTRITIHKVDGDPIIFTGVEVDDFLSQFTTLGERAFRKLLQRNPPPD